MSRYAVPVGKSGPHGFLRSESPARRNAQTVYPAGTSSSPRGGSDWQTNQPVVLSVRLGSCQAPAAVAVAIPAASPPVQSGGVCSAPVGPLGTERGDKATGGGREGEREREREREREKERERRGET